MKDMLIAIPADCGEGDQSYWALRREVNFLVREDSEMKIVAAIATLCALTGMASAQEKETHVFMGAGSQKCGQIAEMYQSAKSPAAITTLDIMVGSWVGGFMTAANYYRSIGGEHAKDLSSSSMEAEIIAVRRYRNKHPDKLMMLGVVEVFMGLDDQE
jgi:hypothetical protein